jgi:uncharacterized membrane protein YccF (DUF307 family)
MLPPVGLAAFKYGNVFVEPYGVNVTRKLIRHHASTKTQLDQNIHKYVNVIIWCLLCDWLFLYTKTKVEPYGANVTRKRMRHHASLLSTKTQIDQNIHKYANVIICYLLCDWLLLSTKTYVEPCGVNVPRKCSRHHTSLLSTEPQIDQNTHKYVNVFVR